MSCMISLKEICLKQVLSFGFNFFERICMKKIIISTLCVSFLVGSAHTTPARSRVKTPISERVAALGGGGIGALSGLGTYLLLKSDAVKVVGFSIPVGWDQGHFGFAFKALSKTKSVIGATLAGLAAGGLGWKILSRYTAESYFASALKIQNGEECSEPEVLDIVKNNIDNIPSVEEETVYFFAAQENEQMEAVEALVTLSEELSMASYYIDCAVLKLEESTKEFALDIQKEIKDMIKAIKATSLAIKSSESYKYQYSNILEQRRIDAENKKSDAMIRAANIKATSNFFR